MRGGVDARATACATPMRCFFRQWLLGFPAHGRGETNAMKLSHIRDVLAVAEAGSLRAASRQLGITQPSITRSIRDTEHELGVTLFIRRANGVTLTEMGEIFTRRATAVQSELRRVREELEQAKGNHVGQVSVAMGIASSIALMPAILPGFQKTYPHALLKVTESLFQPIEHDILSGEIDFFVGPLDQMLSTTSLLVEKLFDNRRVVVARQDHPLAGATTLAELRGARWIRPSFSTRYGEADFETMFERAGLPQPEIVMHTRSALATLLAVSHSDLLTVLPTQWLDFSHTAERVQAIALTEALHSAPVCIVRRGDMPLTPLAEHLCDLTRKAGLNYGMKLADRSGS